MQECSEVPMADNQLLCGTHVQELCREMTIPALIVEQILPLTAAHRRVKLGLSVKLPLLSAPASDDVYRSAN